ncbi:MAG TPA: anthranilate synthase component I [candidate division Zixibacteria bacterium]|nr:anthranilate synthase component I [candidate division Zixibacteria bacterium]
MKKETTTETNQKSAKYLKVLTEEMPADLETPVSAFLKLRKYGAKILLESVESGTILGRYSFIGIRPGSKIIINQNELIVKNGGAGTKMPHAGVDSPLESLKEILDSLKLEVSSDYPPLLGGAVGYISYDFARFFEKIPQKTNDSLKMPLALFYLIDTLLVFDHVKRRLKIMTLAEEGREDMAQDKIRQIVKLLLSPLELPVHFPIEKSTENLKSNFEKEKFCNVVRKVKEHIVAGDVYQLVISQRFSGTTESDPFMIYRALRMLNPSPYMFFLDFDDIRLIGSSPEALVRLEKGIATVRPIAGTRPRSEDNETDKKLEEQLHNDEKEKAEHVMLVDLGRNDLGRCCEVGSVKVTDFMKTERYSHVMHMTSNVIGKLKSGLNQFDLFRAAFPAGTVTGAPKIKTMQLIEELENIRRGPYAGAAGYFSLTGDMDWCITIRTIIMKNKDFFLQAGAGIVADSVPENEYQETCDKLAALKKAIEIAEEGF